MARAPHEFQRLIDIVARLRAPDGCPWDREQTIDSLKPYVLEETYEVLEAIDAHDHKGLCEELGDFLFEAVFVAQLEAEAGHFTIADSVKNVADKLVRRHPHVFKRDDGEPALDTANQVRTRWEEIKAVEQQGKKAPKTLLSGVPEGLPALLRAYQIGVRVGAVGFDWATPDDVVTKMREEVDEVQQALASGSIGAVTGDVANRDPADRDRANREPAGRDPADPDPADRDRVEEEIGDLLFSIANLARKLGVEPETALRKANAKFARRFTTMETAVTTTGRKLSDLTPEELESQWAAVKADERAAPSPSGHRHP